MKTVTSREFNQNVSHIKKESANGPVFITDRGKAAHVLMSIEDYNGLTKTNENIVTLLSMPKAADVEFDVPKINSKLYTPEEFK